MNFWCFSALQRAEIAEIDEVNNDLAFIRRFSALQRAEIAEIVLIQTAGTSWRTVSVLFNEPKLLKCGRNTRANAQTHQFQCSSTSRNC